MTFLGLASLLTSSLSWAQIPSNSTQPDLTLNYPTLESLAPESEAALDQVTSVSQLTDVQPTDWAFQALQSLVERYSCLVGYPTSNFLGHRAISRYEFAAGLSACLDRVNELLASTTINLAKQDDLLTLQKLQTDFAPEIASLKSRINQLEARTTTLAAQQFSTTTKLTGQTIFAINAGGFGGDRIIAPRGAIISRRQPNATSLYRVSFDLNTSFSGADLLKLRLVAASAGIGDNAAGFLEPNLGSALDFAIPGREQLSLARLYYTFTPTRDLSVTLGAQMIAADFIDKNRYANVSFRDFSTASLVNNFILIPRPGGAGAAISWNPKQSAFSLRAVYIANSASANLPENQPSLGGGTNDIRLFPINGGGATGGLFGDPYLGVIELEYAPAKSFSFRLQYSGGQLLGSNFRVIGANVDWALTRQIGVFARYGYGSYLDTTLGDIEPQYWSTGITFQDLLLKNDLAGIGIVQPLILDAVGNATQTNFEAFYNIPISPNVRITPLLQVISNPANQSSNGTIITGTLRTVFNF